MDDRDALLTRIYVRGDRLRFRRRALGAVAAVVAGVCVLVALFASAASGRRGVRVEFEPNHAPASSSTTTVPEVPFRQPPWPCQAADPTPSLRPAGSLPTPGAMPSGSFMQRIHARGYLVVGVDQDAVGFAHRIAKGQPTGFDIDLAREIARAIFGNPDAIVFRSLTSAQRIPAVANGEVDIVADLLSITCSRWQQVDFTTPYYLAHQGPLVRADSPIRSILDLGDKRVCAIAGSASIADVTSPAAAPNAHIVTAAQRSDCLLALQQGAVDAITNDDTILAGLQSGSSVPTRLLPARLEPEPYGMAIARSHSDFVRFVNAVLERLRATGQWSRLVNQDVVDPLHLPPQAPTPPEYRP